MKIDFATLAFGYSVKVGGATPNWATALGQGKEHKINDIPEINEILKGMMHKSVSLEKVSTKIGKGGNVVVGNVTDSPIVLAAVFSKVYVNDTLIDGGKYILMITKDTSKSHYGRLRLKYGPSNTFEENGKSYSNQSFIQQMKKQLGMSDDACWFVTDIDVMNQDTLVLKTVIVDAEKSIEYENTEELHKAWGYLEPAMINSLEPEHCDKDKNRIVFGAPGTGKSHRLEEDSRVFGKNIERVTFHPNYSYAQFVGTYKPVQGEDDTEIKYEYVPGPFMRVYKQALNDPKKEFLLIIEEINRANVAAVFGDVFQLLDRKRGVSEYPIAASEDIKKYLFQHLECCDGMKWEDLDQESRDKCLFLKIPSNMFIWATMNSADQGVFPMDTAFKRRWEFDYISVDDEKQLEAIHDYEIPMCMENTYYVRWEDLRDGINSILKLKKINEDKLLGPFFISKVMLDSMMEVKNIRDKIAAGEIHEPKIIEEVSKKEKAFIKAFESKVIMYLFEDVMKMRPGDIFIGHSKNNGNMIFSEICKAFEQEGENIFDINLKSME